MKFGHVHDISNVDWRLPPLDPRSLATLRLHRDSVGRRPLAVHVGCPVWTAQTWVGGLFPAGVSRNDFLATYARGLNTVELNASFYAVPAAESIARWRRSVPEGFQFCPKVPQSISRDVARGRVNRRVTREFVEAIRGLGPTLGPVFLQLPPGVGLAQMVPLRELLDEFAAFDLKLSLEVRNPELLPDGRLLPELAELLVDAAMATVITDTAGERRMVHSSLTFPRVMIRFAGNHPDPTDMERLASWVDRIALWSEAGLETLHFMIHQTEERGGPELCRTFSGMLNARLGLDLPLWEPEGQLSLF
ncbi:MAG: hypothetical protein ACI9MR_002518 [Myxococcota bacterium]|jgi:uncharacterized protein YecE (DUF72 family)